MISLSELKNACVGEAQWYLISYARNIIDNLTYKKYTSVSFHINVFSVSALFVLSGAYIMNSIYGLYIYKTVAVAGISVFSILEAMRYFEDVEAQINNAIDNNNWSRVNALVKHRVNVSDFLDKFSSKINCKNRESDDCDSVIESAVKFVDYAQSSSSKSKAINFAVSLALSEGKADKIPDNILSKINSDAFDNLLEMISSYFINDHTKKIKAQAIELMYRILENTTKDGYSGLILNNAVRYMDTCLINGINFLVSEGRADKIPDNILSKIKGSDAFDNLLEMISSYFVNDHTQEIKAQAIELMYRILESNSYYTYTPKDGYSGLILNNTVSYVLESDKLGLRSNLPEKVTNMILKKCIDDTCLINGINLLVSEGKADKISDDTISKEKVQTLKKILENTYTNIKEQLYDIKDTSSYYYFKKENAFIIKIVSFCMDECIPYGMETFYKLYGITAYQNINLLAKQSTATKEIINLISLSELKNACSGDESLNSCPGYSLESIVFKKIISNIEKEKSNLSPDKPCLSKAEDSFHKLLYGEIAFNEESLGNLENYIEKCYYENDEIAEQYSKFI